MNKPLIISFGSQVKGRATSRSDFDFAVLKKKPLSLSGRVALAGRLAEKFTLNEDKIDLVDLASASPLLKFQVAQDGNLVEGDRADFIRFKVRAFKEYVDTAKFRRLREEVLSKKYA